jgi:hypothetical protein
VDQTYGALGIYVAEREIGVDGPIRKHYLVTQFDTDDESDLVTEVMAAVGALKRTLATLARPAPGIRREYRHHAAPGRVGKYPPRSGEAARLSCRTSHGVRDCV